MRLYQDQPSGTVLYTKQLRRDAPAPERRLLRAVRGALPDLKWRYQAPVGPYFVDILCFSEALAIEVDGDTHAATYGYDATRTRFIEREGFRVLRFANGDVTHNLDGVLAAIATSLSRREREGAHAKHGNGEGDEQSIVPRSPSPCAAMRLAPLPQGEGL